METLSFKVDVNRLFDTYAKHLCLYALNYVETKEDAEDIVQDVFMRFWEKKHNRFPNEKAIKVYLFNSVRNACLDRVAKKEVRRYNIDLLKEEVIDEETFYFDEKILQDIQQELADMPEQTRKILTGVFLRNMKYQEVADELEISINTVKTLLRNGIKHLRTRFSGHVEILFLGLRKIRSDSRRILLNLYPF